MDLTPIPVTVGASRVPDRCIVRGQRLVQVKFVALPLEQGMEKIGDRPPFPLAARAGFTLGNSGLSPIFSFIHRVIGRLVAARP